MMPDPEYEPIWDGAHHGRDDDLLRPIEWDQAATVAWHTQENRPREGVGRLRRGERRPYPRERRRRGRAEYQAMRERLGA